MGLMPGEQRAPGGVVDPDGRQVVAIEAPVVIGSLIVQNSLVPVAFDEIDLAYTGSNLTTVRYRAASVLVATLTLAYTGSTLTSVVRT